MSLDDRTLREHLDRRATAGVTDVEGIAEVVMTRVAADRGPWWRRLGVRTRSLGIAAAAVVVIVVALAVLPPRIWPGPGASLSASDPSVATGYPADRPLTAKELDTLLGPSPADRAGVVVIADVGLEELPISCPLPCPFAVTLPSRTIKVVDLDPPVLGALPDYDAPQAFRVLDNGQLGRLGSVRPGPGGLAWTLPQLTAVLPDLRGPGANPAPQLYLVEAWRVVSPSAYRCPVSLSDHNPDFGCGPVAWLVQDEDSVPSTFNSAPLGSLRVPNVPSEGDRPGPVAEHGFWLVDPLIAQDPDRCFLCASAGTADLIGRVLTLDDLAFTPATPPPPAYPANRALTADEFDRLISGDVSNLIGRTLISDVELRVQSVLLCPVGGDCPEYMVDLPSGTRYIQAGADPLLPGPYALQLREDGMLDLLGSVRPAPSALTWTFGDYLAEIQDLLPRARLTSQAYLVEASAVYLAASPPCPSRLESPGSTFDVGCGHAVWLVPPGSASAGGVLEMPDVGVRVQNDAPVAWPAEDSGVTSYFLVRPLGVDTCFMCTPNSTSQLLATVDPIDIAPASTALPTTAPGPTAGASELAVEDIAFSTESVTLDGFETADVNVSVTFGGDVVQYHQTDGSLTPMICLERDGTPASLGPHPSVLSRTLVPIGGAAEPWVASFRLTSGDRGTWRVTCVVAYDADGHELSVYPALGGAAPVLEVIGTHAPHLTMEFDPSPAVIGEALEVSGRVTDEESGDPLAGVVVAIGQGSVCTGGGTGPTVATNPNGVYTYLIAAADDLAVCTWISDLDGAYPTLSGDPIAIFATLFAHPTEP